ncbi:MAG: Gfo/Idh/MocA family oxidoreductase [bacterium]|nr:Gfo/Idh/MocA family oxidoreductase [bacterium]
MTIRIGVVGCGSFARSFIPLLQAHPLVDGVVLCDVDVDKRAAASQTFGLPETSPSLDDLCGDDSIDAVALFTQNWLHAPQAVTALRAGKHVYSAVPTGITPDEISSLVSAVQDSGRVYMLGETSYYYPAVLYCRQRFSAGDFGRAVYAEAEYIHDFDHGLYDVMKWRGGQRWRETAGGPPMHYPTHSTSQILSVTGARMTHVSCQGFVDDHEDGLFGVGANRWDNPFSNQTALFRLSDGSSCRVNEMRRLGHPGAVRMSLFGTQGSFEQQVAGARWLTRNGQDTEVVDAQLACVGVPAAARGAEPMAVATAADGTHEGMSVLHPVHRLPREFLNSPSGHAGSHQFLIDDFVRAAVDGAVPPNNVWAAARYAMPGIIAHESAMQQGMRLDIPDFGDAPSAPVEYLEPPS